MMKLDPKQVKYHKPCPKVISVSPKDGSILSNPGVEFLCHIARYI
jgi:hypothetical protein